VLGEIGGQVGVQGSVVVEASEPCDALAGGWPRAMIRGHDGDASTERDDDVRAGLGARCRSESPDRPEQSCDGCDTSGDQPVVDGGQGLSRSGGAVGSGEASMMWPGTTACSELLAEATTLGRRTCRIVTDGCPPLPVCYMSQSAGAPSIHIDWMLW
jgi:hypothetical protein